MATRYRCVDCKKVRNGSTKVRWCDDCGGELKALRYGPQRKKVRRG